MLSPREFSVRLIWAVVVATLICLLFWREAKAQFTPLPAKEPWTVTFYCACPACCGDSADGIFASGRKVYLGGVAVNWLPFGTKVRIEGLGEFVVEDRGAKKYFGTKENPIKHVDIYVPAHWLAKLLGKQKRTVEVLHG